MAILGPDFSGLPFRSQMSAGSAPRRFCDLGEAARVVADRLRRLNRCSSGLSCIVEGCFPVLDPFGDAERVIEALLSTLLHCRYSMDPDMGANGRTGGFPPVYMEVLSFLDAHGIRQARLMAVVESISAAALAQLARGHLIETSLPERIDALRGILQIADLGSRVIVRLDFPQHHLVDAGV